MLDLENSGLDLGGELPNLFLTQIIGNV